MTTATEAKLHIGGTETKEGWSVLNIQQVPGVDYVGDIQNMPFDDGAVDEIYACHILEHLSYQGELQKALKECRRVLKPGGVFRISVPNLLVLCGLLCTPGIDPSEQMHLMRIIYGGQVDEYDHHKTGFTVDLLASFLSQAGFETMKTVETFGLFQDCSEIVIGGQLISINVEAT